MCSYRAILVRPPSSKALQIKISSNHGVVIMERSEIGLKRDLTIFSRKIITYTFAKGVLARPLCDLTGFSRLF